MTDWQPLAAQLAANLAGEGAIIDVQWRRAFEQTPRHLFVPRFWALDQFNAPTRLVDGADPVQREEWLAAAYRDEFMATQYADVGATAHTSGGQHAWLDTSDTPHQWPLPTA